MNSGSPQILATLVGHTSTIKSVTFMDASRTANTPHNSNVIVSGGRDGNIHLYDLRCRGNAPTNTHDGPSGRTRRSQGPQGGATSAGISPILTLKQPHNVSSSRRTNGDSVSLHGYGYRAQLADVKRSVSRTITSLVSLQTMPGVLASGGSYDG